MGGSPDPPSPPAPSPPPSKTEKKSFSSLFQNQAKVASSSTSPPVIYNFEVAPHKGEPGLKIPKAAIEAMSLPFKFTLIGKFSHGRPSMERMRQIFARLALKGTYSLGHLDLKHLLIRLTNEEDFKRIWMKELWFFDGFPMRPFKWTPEFRLDVESPIVPVWIMFPNLPLFLMNMQALFNISSLIGKPLTLDAPTADLSRPSTARVCVEVDLLKRLPPRLWLDCEAVDGFWQEVIYEKVPHYCKHCRRLGHDVNACMIAHPELAKKSVPREKTQTKAKDNPSQKPTGESSKATSTKAKTFYRATGKSPATDPTSQANDSEKANPPTSENVHTPAEKDPSFENTHQEVPPLPSEKDHPPTMPKEKNNDLEGNDKDQSNDVIQEKEASHPTETLEQPLPSSGQDTTTGISHTPNGSDEAHDDWQIPKSAKKKLKAQEEALSRSKDKLSSLAPPFFPTTKLYTPSLPSRKVLSHDDMNIGRSTKEHPVDEDQPSEYLDLPPGLVQDCTLQDLQRLHKEAKEKEDLLTSEYESSEWEEELPVDFSTRKKNNRYPDVPFGVQLRNRSTRKTRRWD